MYGRSSVCAATQNGVAPVSDNRFLPTLGDVDLHLFNEGTHRRLWEKLGAHPRAGGTWFGVWAPSARHVSVFGDVGDWTTEYPLHQRGASGIWAGEVPGFGVGDLEPADVGEKPAPA